MGIFLCQEEAPHGHATSFVDGCRSGGRSPRHEEKSHDRHKHGVPERQRGLDQPLVADQMGIVNLAEGSGSVRVVAGEYQGGEPIDEPVVQYGPFVMNTQQEIQEAISDFNRGKVWSPGRLSTKSDAAALHQRIDNEERDS
jgi:hypothetical protein